MWHTFFVIVHAVAGGVALLTGCVAIGGGTLLRTYLIGLAVMELALVPAVAFTWSELNIGARVLFGAFLVLGLVMIWRGELARRLLPPRDARPCGGYVEHIGFTLVSLTDAFVVVLVLDLGAPIWLVVASGIAIAIAGHYAIRTARDRLASERIDYDDANELLQRGR